MEEVDLVDAYLRRAVTINRVAEVEAGTITRKLREHNKLLEIAIEDRAENLTAKKVNALQDNVSNSIRDLYGNVILPDADELISQVARREAAWNVSTLKKTSDKAIDILVPDMESLINNAKIKPYQGRTFGAWFGDLGASEIQKINSAISTAWVTEMPPEELMEILKGIFKKTEADIKTLARSYLQHTAVEARSELLAENDDIYDGSFWSSVLDHRTTALICGIRDTLEYDKDHNPVGHDLGWEEGPGRIHFNCRSIEIPKIKGIKFSARRPAVGAGKKYRQGDSTNTRGKVRKPTKSNRDKEILKVSHVSAETTYETFLRRQPKAFVADVLNSKEDAEAFKNGARLKSFLPEIGPEALGKLSNQSIKNL